MNDNDANDLLALGAAGALSDDEYNTLEELLTTDPLLAAEYHELQASASVLAEATSEVPPPSLRASVLDAVKNVEQLPAAPPAAVQVATFPSTSVPADSAPHRHVPANVVPIHRRRWMIPATAAAAVVMLLGGSLIVNHFADAPSDDRMSAVLNADDATTIELSGSLEGLRLIASDDEDAVVLVGSDVTMPATGMVFQLWALHDDEMVGMATFTPAATGKVEILIDDDGPSAEWAVTVEPEGGSDQPTSDPIAVSPGLT